MPSGNKPLPEQKLTEIHYSDVIMGDIASQITSLAIVYSTVYSGTDQRKHQSSASLAFVLGIHRRPVNSLHKWPVTRKIFPFDDITMSMSPYGITRQQWVDDTENEWSSHWLLNNKVHIRLPKNIKNCSSHHKLSAEFEIALVANKGTSSSHSSPLNLHILHPQQSLF